MEKKKQDSTTDLYCGSRIQKQKDKGSTVGHIFKSGSLFWFTAE